MISVRRLLPDNPKTPPVSIERLRERGFDKAYERILKADVDQVIAELEASGITGRGGAAFPTGRKWRSVKEAPGSIKYAIMNADESELGTFKDRVLIEQDPLGPLVGLILAAKTVGATHAYCYIRGEYRQEEKLLTEAVDLLQKHGWVGPESGVDIEIRRGAGAYVAGEETALFNSIEGKRPEPRVKPPFPTVHGVFGAPTLIQNVETLANVALLLGHDVNWFREVGTQQNPGTKLVALSGHIKHPGVYEVPFGTALSDILLASELGGGVGGSEKLGAVLIGGAAGTFLTPDEIAEATLDYPSLARYGASIGSGAMMVFDDTVDLLGVVERLARFFADESCGQCVPCRIGTQRIKEFVRHPQIFEEAQNIRSLGMAMRDASICGLGQTAPIALLSLLDRPQLIHAETL
ncbi:complex I 51 kDa subunit family protein [Sulfobacillus thermosulfidooxidans]|uniref:complex I 51 kDa subunit family protein n=1 Tax=Sulfobacillus thermosulfidooxidans TaxID=28034 RepID=UPI0006B4CD0E|nr:NADH-ubiquinone oxidoreductase-F iron-sulfur binding region domain-containing protein [Sulfobacillus thermosulfidooxidans]